MSEYLDLLRGRLLPELKHDPERFLRTVVGLMKRRGNEDLRRIAEQIERCLNGGPRCHKVVCPKCGVYQGSRRKRSGWAARQGGSRSIPKRNPHRRPRDAALRAFGDLPEEHIGNICIQLAVVDHLDVVDQVIDQTQEHLHRFLDRKLPGAKALLWFESVQRHVRQVPPTILPDTRWKQRYRESDLVWLVHAHGLIHVEGLTPKEIADAFRTNPKGSRSRYSGARQVQVQAIKHNYDGEGQDRWGVGGAAGYAAKARCDLADGAANTHAVLEWVSLMLGLDRRNRRMFRHGLNRKKSDIHKEQAQVVDGQHEKVNEPAGDQIHGFIGENVTNCGNTTHSHYSRFGVSVSRPVHDELEFRTVRSGLGARGPPAR